MTDITKIINSINNNKYIEDDDFNITDIDTDKKNSPQSLPANTPKVSSDNVLINIDSEDKVNNDIENSDTPEQINAIKKIGSKTFRTHVIKD
jgi:hypothetical protein